MKEYLYNIDKKIYKSKDEIMAELGIKDDDTFYNAVANRRYKNKVIGCTKVEKKEVPKKTDTKHIDVYYIPDYNVTTAYSQGKLIFTFAGNRTKEHILEHFNKTTEISVHH